MNHHPLPSRRRPFSVRVICNGSRPVALAAALMLAASPLSAAEPYGNSLDWAPADAAVFSTSLRLKEQLEVIANSNAWQRFKEIPTIAMGWQMAEMQINNPNGPAAVFWQLMELPENKQLVKMLGEMFSDEVVFYAGEDFAKTIELLSYVQGSRFAPMIEAIEAGDDEPVDPGSARLRAVLGAIEEDPALADVPQFVLAFRVQDTAAAETQLARLEVLANLALRQSDLGVKFERREMAGAEFISLSLHGGMLPWEDDPPAGPISEEDYYALRDIISDKELVISLGVWNDYVIVSIGKSADHLAALGEGPAVGSRPELAALDDHRDKRLCSIYYVSENFVRQGAATPEDFDDFAAMIGDAIQSSDDAPEGIKDRASADLAELANDLKPYLPEPGAVVGFQFLTETGMEGYTYNWATQMRLDSSQPLAVLQHVGGAPLIAVASRGVHDPDAYDTVVKWVGKAYSYVEYFAVEEMDETEREEVIEALGIAKPLLARLDKTTREHLIPAMKDGQSAVVIDADITQTQWHEDMPRSFAPLPMAELAIVMGVSDVDEFRTAMRQYKSIADDAIEILKEKAPDEVYPGAHLPDPEVRSADGGTVYVWNLPAEAGLDKRIALCGAVGERFVAFATSTDMAERVLAPKPLPAARALGDDARPRAVVAGIDFAGFIEAVAPWVEYGIRISFLDEDAVAENPADDPAEVQDVVVQVQMGLEILQCFRGAWMETREEEGVWVTHSVTTFKDLED